MARRKANSEYTVHNSVKIIRGGAAYFDLVKQIAEKAIYSLHLQTYIYDEDETGEEIALALIEASQRGVRVYMLLDGYASQRLSRAFVTRLCSAGIQFSFFEPVMKSRYFYIGRRLHHKVLVADGRYAVVAGINISNRYNDIGPDAAWLDWAAYVEGDAARQLDAACIKRWNGSVFRRKCEATALPEYSPPTTECSVRVRVNDWVYKRTQITRTYREMFVTARQEVILMTSYFWPTGRLRKRMSVAAARGVAIKLILTEKADVAFAKYAERYLYKWLFRHNIEVYEYRANVLHGKVCVADRTMVTIGSYNVNNISAFASVELNLDIKNTETGEKVADEFNKIITDSCVKIDPDSFWTSNAWYRKAMFYFSYRIVQMIFTLFTFYFTQRRDDD